MVKNFVRVGLWPAAPALARDLLPLLAAHKREMGFVLGVNSIYRTKSEQAAIFTSRYSRGARSPYGDYRWYQGAQWGRTSGLGPVASPDVGSNHTRGYAVDFAISHFSPSFTWLKNNAHRWGFNHTEGASINEPWHWVWRIGIFPNSASPDPWEGRGAPDPVYASDPGMDLSGSGGGGNNSEVPEMNAEETKMLKEALAAAKDAQRYAKAAYHRAGEGLSIVKWLKARIRGSVKQKSITTTASEARDAAQWVKARVKGSVKGASITAMLQSIQEAVVSGAKTSDAAIFSRAMEIDASLATDADARITEVDEAAEPVTDEV